LLITIYHRLQKDASSNGKFDKIKRSVKMMINDGSENKRRKLNLSCSAKAGKQPLPQQGLFSHNAFILFSRNFF